MLAEAHVGIQASYGLAPPALVGKLFPFCGHGGVEADGSYLSFKRRGCVTGYNVRTIISRMFYIRVFLL